MTILGLVHQSFQWVCGVTSNRVVRLAEILMPNPRYIASPLKWAMIGIKWAMIGIKVASRDTFW
jgi:hypothetical protein